MSDSDPKDRVEALPYAVPRASGWRRLKRILLVVMPAAIVFCAVWFGNLEWGGHGEICGNCGASSGVSDIYFFRLDWHYGRTIREGVISKFIQAYDGTPCSHDWQFVHGNWRSLSGRSDGVGGAGFGLSLWIRQLEGCGIATWINEKKQKDPGAIKRLVDGIRNYDGSDKSPLRDIFEELSTE